VDQQALVICPRPGWCCGLPPPYLAGTDLDVPEPQLRGRSGEGIGQGLLGWVSGVLAGRLQADVLALTTGLRRGELLALRWDDIDFGSRQLHVLRAMQRVDGKLQVAAPKTGSARRTVVLPYFAVRHLEEHKKRQDAERLALGDTWREHGLVFASSVGTPIEPRNVNRRWDELRQRAGLDGLRLHDLRHGCATFLFAQGVPARAIMDVLGHAEIGVTMNTYAHVLPVLRQEAADAIDELFGT
jgi:integrase